jgi:hypothetical protein
MRRCTLFFIWTFFCLSDGFCQSVVDQNIVSLIYNHWPEEVVADGSNVIISRTVSKIGEIQHYYIQQQWNDIEIMSAINSVHLQANSKYYSPNRFFSCFCITRNSYNCQNRARAVCSNCFS